MNQSATRAVIGAGVILAALIVHLRLGELDGHPVGGRARRRDERRDGDGRQRACV